MSSRLDTDRAQERPTKEIEASTGKGETAPRLTLAALPLDAANKSEHIPPVIIKSGSFRLEIDNTFAAPTGVFHPPFTYQYRFPFKVRAIRVVDSPFGTPETLFYKPDPDDCAVKMVLLTSAGGELNLNLANVEVGTSRTLVLTTDHALPPVTPVNHPDRPHRYIYADDGDPSVQLRTIIISGTGDQILYQAETTPDTYISLWRRHEH